MPNPYINICYQCPHASPVLGSSHHQACNILGDPVELLAYTQITNSNPLEIKGNQHGIDSGWFTWPIDFDPVWLEHCLFAKHKLLE